MELTGHFKQRSADVAWEDFHGEFVVLDLESGRYFSLVGGGAIVWRGLTSGHSMDALCATLPPDDPRRSEVMALVESLLEYKLLVPSSSPLEATGDVPTELAGSEGPFKIDMFDDLADLLLADPIHEVDPDTGWPMPRAPQG
jgi:hypothetical protein